MNLSQASQPKLIGALVTVLGLLVAIFVGRAVGNGSYLPILLIMGALFGTLFFFALGDRYWYMIPFSLGSHLPAIPLGGRTIELAEATIAACTMMFVFRIALKKEKPVILRGTHVPVLLFMAWIVMTLMLHPVGFLIFGSADAGARFYLKVFLAFASFVILSSREIKESDAKWIIGLLLLGSLLQMAMNIAEYTVFGHSIATGQEIDSADGEQTYTWHQVLSLPALIWSFLIFSRYKPSEIFSFSRPGILLIYACTLLLALLSGKRMGLTGVLLAPMVGAVIHRQFRYVVISFLMTGVLLAIIVAGQGQLFTLPINAQRALSWLPADWDPSLDNIAGGTDEFREELRRLAIEDIKRNPLIGNGFAVDISETASAINAAQMEGGVAIMVLPYALGKSWHNTWLGYSADFGIPLAVIQGALLLTVLITGFRTARRLKYPSMLQTITVFIVIYTARDIIASHTSGHSALDAFDRWWMYGLLFSVAASSLKGLRDKTSPTSSSSLSLPKSGLPNGKLQPG